MKKLYDLRFVIGVFFTIAGLLLTGYHLFTDKSPVPEDKLNLWSGVFYTVFGIVMMGLSYTKTASSEER
jgi:hypothetical protein